jgi:pyrimidine-nucleoside phosphorylase
LQNIECQGGSAKQFLELRGSYRSELHAEVRAKSGGFITRIDAWKVGHAGVDLGVGRDRTEDAVSPTAGIQFHRKRGEEVKTGDLIMTLWAGSEAGLQAALPQLEDAVEYTRNPPRERKLILKEIASGVS